MVRGFCKAVAKKKTKPGNKKKEVWDDKECFLAVYTNGQIAIRIFDKYVKEDIEDTLDPLYDNSWEAVHKEYCLK